MSRSRALLLAASVAVGGAALATASPASATLEPIPAKPLPVTPVPVDPGSDPVAELNALCLRKSGLVVWSPYSLARCQSARNNKGFEQEQILCEVGLDGTLVVTQLERMNRSTWACFDF
jgi:hypothetical protein